MRKRVGVMTLAAAGALAFGGTYAKAANIGVLGTKLIVVDKGASGAKAVFVAKDPAVTKGTGTDTTTIGVTFDFTYDNGVNAASAGQFTAPAGSSNWLVNKTTVAKYVNKTAPTGGGAKVVVIKPANLVKLVGKNLGDTPIDIFNQAGAATGTAHTAFNIADSSTSFNDTFCTTFAGCAWKSIAGGTGAKLVCKGGTADPACTASTPPPPCGPGGGSCLKFQTAAAGGTCGHVKSGGTAGTVRKNLTCGGLNIGGGQSTVAEGPTPAGAPTFMNVSGVAPNLTVTGRTAADTGSNNFCSATGCVFGPWLPIASAGTSTCVQNSFLAPGITGTVNTVAGTFNGAYPLNSAVYLTSNGTEPCPKCLAGVCDNAWTAGTGNPYPDKGKACVAVNGSGDTYDCAPPPGTLLGPITVNLNPISTGTTFKFNAGGLFCPSQGNTGAFGCAGDGTGPNAICPGGNVAPLIDYVEEVGTPAGPLSSAPATGTIASIFCIPTVGGALGFLVNGAGNLPGPGATSLPGTFTLLP